jgi:hypothetical protein
MMRAGNLAGVVAALALAAQPALAADLVDDRPAMRRTTMFVGASMRLDLDQRRPRPVARLQAGMAPVPAPGQIAFRRGGLELGVTGRKARMYLAGQDAQALRNRMGVGTTETVLLVGAGVLVLLVVVAAAATPGNLLDTCDDGPECL